MEMDRSFNLGGGEGEVRLCLRRPLRGCVGWRARERRVCDSAWPRECVDGGGASSMVALVLVGKNLSEMPGAVAHPCCRSSAL